MKNAVLMLLVLAGTVQAERFTASPKPDSRYVGIKGPYLGQYLVWDAANGGYRVPNRPRSLNPKLRNISDTELQEALGISPVSGDVQNDQTVDYDIELGTFAGYLPGPGSVKVGPYLKLWRFNEKAKVTLDVAESYVGGSLRYDFTSLLRPSIGIGAGTLLDGNWYGMVSGSFRVW